MDSEVYWVTVHRSQNVESGLLETERHTAGPAEQVDGDWGAATELGATTRFFMFPPASRRVGRRV